LTSWGFGYDYPDGSEFLTIALQCGSTAGQAYWCDPVIDEMGEEIAALPLDDPKRTELLREVQRIAINEQAYLVPLYARNALILSQDYVKGDQLDPLLTLPVAENVWIDQG